MPEAKPSIGRPALSSKEIRAILKIQNLALTEFEGERIAGEVLVAAGMGLFCRAEDPAATVQMLHRMADSVIQAKGGRH